MTFTRSKFFQIVILQGEKTFFFFFLISSAMPSFKQGLYKCQICLCPRSSNVTFSGDGGGGRVEIPSSVSKSVYFQQCEKKTCQFPRRSW